MLRQVRVLIRLNAAQVRLAVLAERIQSRRIEAHVRAVEVRVVRVVQAARPHTEAPMVLRKACRDFVHHRVAQHLRVRARQQIPGEHVVHRADARRDAVVCRAVVTVEQRPHAEAVALVQHRIDARDEVHALVNRLRILRVVRGPLLASLLVEDAVGHRQQVEHPLAHWTDAIPRE